MSRIEKPESSQVPVAPIKDEVIETLNDPSKKVRGKCSCLLFVLGLFLVVFCVAVWGVAAAGIVRIPGVSSVAFTDPKPVHIVVPGTPAEQVAQSSFQSTLLKRIQASGGTLTDRSVTIRLSESSFTASLRNQLALMNLSFIDNARAQIAILPNQEIEVFLPIRVKEQSTALALRFLFTFEHGAFNLKVTRAKLGSVSLPVALTSSFLESYVNRELASLNQTLGSYMNVSSLQTDEKGQMELTGTFTVEVKK